MEKDLLNQLSGLEPAEVRVRLFSLVHERGAAALPMLEAALGIPALAQPAVEALGELPAQESWELLEQIAQEGEPISLRKSARRMQHRLRSRGFSPVQADAAQATASTVELAQATFFDHIGAQVLRVVRSAALGIRRYAAFLLIREGIQVVRFQVASRADIESRIEQEDDEMGPEMIDIGLAYVARRVREAAAVGREHHRSMPVNYPDAVRLLEDAPADKWPPELLAAQGPLSPREAEILVSDEGVSRWAFSSEQLDPYVRDWIRMIEYQPVHTKEGLPNLSALQAQGRMVAGIIDDLFDEATLLRFPSQLRETARLYYAEEKKDLADFAMRAAVSLEKNPVQEEPFLHALVNYSMAVTLKEERQEREAEAKGPWVEQPGESGSLWVPRPTAPPTEEEEEEGPHRPSGLWLPGQD